MQAPHRVVCTLKKLLIKGPTHVKCYNRLDSTVANPHCIELQWRAEAIQLLSETEKKRVSCILYQEQPFSNLVLQFFSDEFQTWKNDEWLLVAFCAQYF